MVLRRFCGILRTCLGRTTEVEICEILAKFRWKALILNIRLAAAEGRLLLARVQPRNCPIIDANFGFTSSTVRVPIPALGTIDHPFQPGWVGPRLDCLHLPPDCLHSLKAPRSCFASYLASKFSDDVAVIELEDTKIRNWIPVKE